jgi:Fanconi anemia group M protein
MLDDGWQLNTCFCILKRKVENEPIIQIDHRECHSKVPDCLKELHCKIQIVTLRTGDYIVNQQVLVERKTADDFVVSLIQGRLFDQCERLVKGRNQPLIIIEGNPLHTNHDIEDEAIHGALISLATRWVIPVLFTKDARDTARKLMVIAKQNLKYSVFIGRHGYKPKNRRRKQLLLLQALPLIGVHMSACLLDHFGSIKAVMEASESDLKKVDGIGDKRAGEIFAFIRARE